jgi:penicillin-binding protein 2
MLTRGAYEDRQNLQSRLLALRIIVVLVFAVLAVGFWVLQVVNHQRYADIAEDNRLRSIVLRAPRGLVYDRENRILVQNRSSFTIALIRDRSDEISETLRLLAEYAWVDPADLAEVYDRHRNEPEFRPLPLIEHATMAQVASVMLHGAELPDIEVIEVPTRTYPEGGLASHLFGYVSEIQQAQIERGTFEGVSAGATVGQTGLEFAYNAALMGEDGTRVVVVDSRGREVEPVGTEPPVNGNLLQLTIDYDLQRALEDAFRYYELNGAAAFLDPNTGEVLAMTSLPGFDPNAFAVGIDRTTYAELTTDPLLPLMNDAIQGRYMPGSTFKVAMAVAGLGDGVITPEHREYCAGSARIYGRTYQCHKTGGHGAVNVFEALQQSCNVFFYKLGERMSIDTIHRYAEKLGLIGRTGIDLPNESASNVPSTAQRAARGERWYPGETISVAIGQGPVEVTPLALARMVSTVANGGWLVTPHIVRATAAPNTPWQPVAAPEPVPTLTQAPGVLEAVREGMWRAVNVPGGTAYNWARIDGRDVAGKTGTAQVISFEGAAAARSRGTTRDLREHGWYVTFAPRDDAQIAGVVFGEHADHGYLVAPIAKHVMETFFAKQEGRPLPQLPTRPGATTTGVAGAGDGADDGAGAGDRDDEARR